MRRNLALKALSGRAKEPQGELEFQLGFAVLSISEKGGRSSGLAGTIGLEDPSSTPSTFNPSRIKSTIILGFDKRLLRESGFQFSVNVPAAVKWK
ncbi:hypothetical protein RSAG8_11053, partial [Rhizoctonia solani AG-8 WAC10335]